MAGLDEPRPEAAAAPAGAARLSVESISLRYPGAAEPALRGVSMEAAAGSFVAVTGPVASGKSALVRAILGLYPLESGAIRIDDRPIEEIKEDERAVRIGYLPQDPHLFSGSITDNILFGGDNGAQEAALARAISCAGLADDLARFPSGVSTEIGELGIQVSGGQRQRIALARCLAAAAPARPGLLLLDDPFSAVDLETERLIIRSLREAFGPEAPLEARATIVLCSHRLAAFPEADQIVVLDGGRVVECGSHAELLNAAGLYARIYRAQAQAVSRTATAPPAAGSAGREGKP